MSNDEFTKLYTYMLKEFSHVRNEFKAVRSEVADVNSAVAELGAELRDYHAELLALGRKVDRMEQAIMHIAQETGVKLKFDF